MQVRQSLHTTPPESFKKHYVLVSKKGQLCTWIVCLRTSRGNGAVEGVQWEGSASPALPSTICPWF